jgi:hypothetical protein
MKRPLKSAPSLANPLVHSQSWLLGRVTFSEHHLGFQKPLSERASLITLWIFSKSKLVVVRAKGS